MNQAGHSWGHGPPVAHPCSKCSVDNLCVAPHQHKCRIGFKTHLVYPLPVTFSFPNVSHTACADPTGTRFLLILTPRSLHNYWHPWLRCVKSLKITFFFKLKKHTLILKIVDMLHQAQNQVPCMDMSVPSPQPHWKPVEWAKQQKIRCLFVGKRRLLINCSAHDLMSKNKCF